MHPAGSIQEAKQIRCFILWVLFKANGYRTNTEVLLAVLDSIGANVSHDKVVTELHWLMEQGYLVYEPHCADHEMYVATLTQRGIDVAFAGKAVPGVAGAFDEFERWEETFSEPATAQGWAG